ncbi:MAG: hypothetical protein ACKV2Q_26425 [Planctomycetaceae bacterium]
MRLVSACCLWGVLLIGDPAVRAEENATVANSVANSAATPKPVSAERVLLLQSGKILKGVVRQTMAGYVINVPGGQMVLPLDQVRFNAESLEDAYHQQRASLPERPVSAHIELARWCANNGLPDQACKELREVLRIEPESTAAKTMLQRITDQLLTTKDLPAVAARNGEYSMLGNPKLGVSAEALGGLPRDAAVDFVAKVQPLLVNRCATAGCHGPGSGSTFELIRTKIGKAPPKPHSEKNLAAVLERIDREQPHNSPLLTKLRSESKSPGIRQSHGGLSREQTQMLRHWIEAISEKPEPVAPVKAESEAEAADNDVKTESLKPRTNTENSDNADDNLYRRLIRELRSSD